MKKILIMFAALFLLIPTMASAHSYNLAGVTYKATDEQIDSFLANHPNSSYPYKFAVVYNYSDGTSRFNLFAFTDYVSVSYTNQLTFTNNGSYAVQRSQLTGGGSVVDNFNMPAGTSNSIDGSYTVTKVGGNLSIGGAVPAEEEDGGWWESISSLEGLKDTVGGWIGSAIGVLVQPIIDLGQAIGSGFDFVKDKISSVITIIGGKISALGNSIGDWFAGLVSDIGSLASNLGKWFGSVLDYLNPFSDNFFIRKAFVPKDGFIKDKVVPLKGVVDDKLVFISQTSSAFSRVRDSISSSEWEGIKATVPLINKTVTFVDPTFVNKAGEKTKIWIGGIIVVMMMFYVVRRGSRIIGAGKG